MYLETLGFEFGEQHSSGEAFVELLNTIQDDSNCGVLLAKCFLSGVVLTQKALGACLCAQPSTEKEDNCYILPLRMQECLDHMAVNEVLDFDKMLAMCMKTASTTVYSGTCLKCSAPLTGMCITSAIRSVGEIVVVELHHATGAHSYPGENPPFRIHATFRRSL